ncbi:hypothetical protein [Longibaculum muris]|uniref:hypothetical protein n=1 Tax=Longibaculum muris TaxID=1796628 RepID=UPI0022E80937|nr:hypothetical protein [Longibaculum muris]
MIEGYFEQYNKKIDSGEIEGSKVKLDNYKNNIYIPFNLTIFATMNTSDQNVFPLDTAFKRRWDRERISIDEEWSNVPEDYKTKYIPNTNVKWMDFVQIVNKQIFEEAKKGVITEDKQIGPYFISPKLLNSKEENENSSEEGKKQSRLNLIKFVNNVVDYLYNDVSKMLWIIFIMMFQNLITKHYLIKI